MAKNSPNRYERYMSKLKGHKALAVVLIIGATVIAIGSFTESVSFLVRLVKRHPQHLSGSISINTDLSPYIQVGNEDRQFPPGMDSDLSFYRPIEDLQFLLPSIRAAALRDKSTNNAPAQFSPTWTQYKASFLHPDPISADRLFRLMLHGAWVLERLRQKYRESSLRTPELDEVFDPHRAWSGEETVEYPRLRSFLSRIYPSPLASEDERNLAIEVVRVSAEIWFSKDEVSDKSTADQEAYRFFRYVILRRTDPVFRITLTNASADPVIISEIICSVEQFVAVEDTNESGPLELLRTVDFNLSGQPGRFIANLAEDQTGPVKLAPKDAGVIQVRINSNVKGAYRLFLSVFAGEHEVYRTEELILAFLAS